MLGFKLKKVISIGEILTSITVLTSVFTFAYGWSQEREKRQKEQVNQVRVAAAETLVKLERWREISSSYQDLHPIFVETSEILAEKKGAIKARDFLWKSLINSRAKNEGKILDEKIELASAELYGYNPEIHELFSCTIKQFKNARETAFNNLLDETEGVVLDSDPKSWSNTALVGNALRRALVNYTQLLQKGVDPALEQTRSILLGIISKKDDEIAKREFGSVKTDFCK